jgi:phosphate acetyltransferase
VARSLYIASPEAGSGKSVVALGVIQKKQGLRKAVNDLSRGGLVRDIVNTVAIIVIQAQK